MLFRSLRDVASTCEAAGDDRAAALTAARGRLAGWKKLRGAKKAAAARACGKDADALAATLTTQTCLPSPDAPGSTGVPECDAYIATLERYVQCAKVPVEAKQAVQQAIPQLLDGWKQLRDPGVAPEVRRATADACRQAAGALRQAAAQTGCTVP